MHQNPLRVCSSSSTILKTPKKYCSGLIRVTNNIMHLSLPKLDIEPKFCPQPCNPKLHVNTNRNIVYEDLEKISTLGRGSYGIVHKVRHRPTSTIYALKIIEEKISFRETTVNPSLSQEIEILSRTNSPDLVKCHGIFDPAFGQKAILMEYMEAGSLETLLKNHGTFSEYILGHIAHQVLSGLSYLHANNIVHLDIKPANLLVNKDMKLKICDFGISKVIDKSNCEKLWIQGTYAYMSPERLDSEKFSLASPFSGDVWSLGITLLELYVGHCPFFPADVKPSVMDLTMEICCGELDDIMPNQASKEFRSFLKACIERDISKRSTASELLSHPFVSMAKDLIPSALLGFIDV